MILGPIAESNWRQTLTITKRTGLLEYFCPPYHRYLRRSPA